MIRGRIVGTSSGSGGNRGCSRRARKSCASAHRAHTPRSSRRASTAHPSSSPAIHEDRTDGGKKGSVIQYCFVGTCLSESVSERPLCSGYQELLSDPFASRTPFAREGPPPVIVHGRGMNACSRGIGATRQASNYRRRLGNGACRDHRSRLHRRPPLHLLRSYRRWDTPASI